MRPSVTAGTSPLRMCRSVPQIVVVSTLTITSVGSWMPGSSTLSQDRCPGPPNTSAFIVSPLRRRWACHHRPVTAPLHGRCSWHRRDAMPDEAREWLEAMLLIRRFEERAGEMYAKDKVGGFLHLAIGEEATIVGAVRAMRDEDYLISTYRSHGHALARGTDPKRVMAELFGKRDRRLGRPRRLDAHVRRRAALHGRLRDRRRQPAARRRDRAVQRLPRDRGGHGLRVRRRRRQPGHVRRDAQHRRAVEAAGGLHGHQQPVRHGHLARAPHRADRPAQARRGLRRARACAATGWTSSTPTR